jgi:Reverse transcriptase (RNA-dependent DNA polymerase).
MALHDSNGKMKMQGQLTEAFGIERGCRQGDALSTTMFNCALEEVIRNIKTNLNGTIFNRTRQHVAYTDDVLINGRSLRATEELVTHIKEAAVSTGLVI